MEREQEEAVDEALARLPEQERQIIKARFGTGGRPARTLRDAAREVGVTQEQARRLEARALERLSDDDTLADWRKAPAQRPTPSKPTGQRERPASGPRFCMVPAGRSGRLAGQRSGMWESGPIGEDRRRRPSGCSRFRRRSSVRGAADYAATALNIIPSGQYGQPPVRRAGRRQAQMYDGLTPLFDDVNGDDLTTYFKSEALGVGTDGPGTTEPVPRPGRARSPGTASTSPTSRATTYDGGIWAAGWIAAEDRGLLLQQARYNARVAAIDAPGLTRDRPDHRACRPSYPSAADRGRGRQADPGRCRRGGKEGEAVLADIDTFISGHQRLPGRSTAARRRRGPATTSTRSTRSRASSWARAAATRPAAPSSSAGLQRAARRRSKGMSVFNDLRQFKNDGSPISIDGNFKYGQHPEASRQGQRRPRSRQLRRRRRPCRRLATARRAAPAAGLEHADDQRASTRRRAGR